MQTILRLLFGAFWLVFGLNNFLHFFPIPAPGPTAAPFMEALMQTGYILPLVFLTQVLTGAMLLANRWVPLALLLLAPVVCNIVLYDVFLNPSGLVIGLVLLAIYVVLLYSYRRSFAPLLRAKP